jgi:hypothetical protein
MQAAKDRFGLDDKRFVTATARIRKGRLPLLNA